MTSTTPVAMPVGEPCRSQKTGQVPVAWLDRNFWVLWRSPSRVFWQRVTDVPEGTKLTPAEQQVCADLMIAVMGLAPVHMVTDMHERVPPEFRFKPTDPENNPFLKENL